MDAVADDQHDEAADDDVADAHVPPIGDNAAGEEATDDVALEDFNPLVIVPYLQPMVRPDQLMIGVVRVAYGPPLPLVVSWTRSFEALMGVFTSRDVPRHLQMPAVMPIVLPKRSWSLAFDETSAEPRILYQDSTPASCF
ncbi:hypothetical protein ZWY2020_030895 [Hordeum vulgare]|nr:hypothetical protein ZWY2020_030895 [Hordeum vulgare]